MEAKANVYGAYEVGNRGASVNKRIVAVVIHEIHVNTKQLPSHHDIIRYIDAKEILT